MIEGIRQQLHDHNAVINVMEAQLLPTIEKVVLLLEEAFRSGKKLLVMGNGGSAADAQHFAAEIVGRFKLERPSLPAIALTTDTSILTAIGNDYGFDVVFLRQIEGLAVKGDVVVGISTSGNSPNVKSAIEKAREKGCKTVAFLGRDGGAILDVAEIAITVPSFDTPRIQEAHITLIHIICDLIEKRMFADKV